MNKILITTIHPAPYIDSWVEELSKEYEVSTLYKYKSTGEKEWKNYVSNQIHLYSDYSFFGKIKLFRKFDFIILCSWGLMENIFISLALIPYNTKVSFFLDHPIIGKSKTNFFAKLVKKLIIKSADCIFPASDSCMNYLNLNYGIDITKMHVFPYAHSYKELEECISINKGREKKIKNEEPVRLFIANRFEERKGYKIVLDAFNILNDQGFLKKFEIIIAGSGEEFHFYKNKFSQLNANIKLLGWIENDKYEAEMEQCDVYLHASIFEPFGIPPLDAMQRGKTVIVSDGVKSCDYLLSEINKGIRIYKSNDSVQLSTELKSILMNKKNLYINSLAIISMVNLKYSSDTNLKAVRNALNN